MAKYITIGLILLAVALLIIFRNKLTTLFTGTTTQPPATVAPGAGTVTTSTAIDTNKLLKKGVTGNEVKQLQGWVGVDDDGRFGSQTEAALLAKKGVTSITLAQYPTIPDVAAVATANDSTGHWYDGLPYSYFFNS